tara:strand:+ start:75 stop:1688 length:1614 start_codon:yes stop_codon:yes gene_type:complete
MAILKNLACVVSDEMRMSAYLLKMIQKGVKPSFFLILRKQGIKEALKRFPPDSWLYSYRKWNIPVTDDDIRYSNSLFSENIFKVNLFKILAAHNIQFEILPFNNFNSKKVIEKVSSLKQNYILMDAPAILKKPFFQIGKHLINTHKGVLPDFRGHSVTHYAVLNKGKYGSSIHFMDEGIDTGPIIATREYEIPKVKTWTQIVIYESYITSDLLSDIMVKFSRENEIFGHPQDRREGETYFGMHPVLGEVSASRQAEGININILDPRYQWLSDVGKKIEECVFSLRDHKASPQKYDFLFQQFQKSGIENFRGTLNFIYDRVFSFEENARTSQLPLILELLERKTREGFSASFFSGQLSEFLLSYLYKATMTPDGLARIRPTTSSFNRLDAIFREAIEDEANLENLILAWFLYFTGGTDGLTSNNLWGNSLRTVQRGIVLQWKKRSPTKGLKLTPLFLGMASVCFLYQYNLSQDVLWVDAAIKADDMAIQLVKSNQTEPLDLMIIFAALQKELEVTKSLYEEGQNGSKCRFSSNASADS